MSSLSETMSHPWHLNNITVWQHLKITTQVGMPTPMVETSQGPSPRCWQLFAP